MVARALQSSSSAVRALLVATLLLGTGQQIFVIARNPFLAELGWRTSSIPAVQATGAIAGVLSGFLATFLVPRVRLHIAFAVCAGVQAVGFALQALAAAPITFFLGAGLAGLAIQLNTAMAPPALKALTREDARVSIFALHAIALTPLAGIGATVLIFGVTFALGAQLLGHRTALVVGAGISGLAAIAFGVARERTAPPQARRLLVSRASRVILCVAFQALLGLAGGITVPFLQLYFKVTFGVPLHGIAFLYGATMALGTLAYAVVPWLSRRFGLARAVVMLQLLTLPFFFELARATNLYVAAAAFVARYTLAATASPLLNAFFQEVSFERDGEAVAGFGMVASSVTWAAGTWLAAPLLTAGGGRFHYAIALSGALYATIGLWAYVAFPRLWRTRPGAVADHRSTL